MQTDDVLRTYPEYAEGASDKRNSHPPSPNNYPLIAQSGVFAKKAYLLGYYEA